MRRAADSPLTTARKRAGGSSSRAGRALLPSGRGIAVLRGRARVRGSAPNARLTRSAHALASHVSIGVPADTALTKRRRREPYPPKMTELSDAPKRGVRPSPIYPRHEPKVRPASPLQTPAVLVVSLANERRTQNGHIRNDTRDVARRIRPVANGLISRRNCVARDRACTRVLLANFHGREGVDGSSPSEGSAKAPQIGAFLTCTISNMRYLWSPLWSLQVQSAGSKASEMDVFAGPREALVHPPGRRSRLL
jgi:hypothetical protein